jgi:hypothetical protein
MSLELSCFKCQTDLSFRDFVPFKECCPKCNSDVHCCLNCKFYDTAAYNSCREPQADRVLDKDRANFCDYFQIRQGKLDSKATKENSAVDKLESLFKK